jgi:hypothetical protein
MTENTVAMDSFGNDDTERFIGLDSEQRWVIELALTTYAQAQEGTVHGDIARDLTERFEAVRTEEVA